VQLLHIVEDPLVTGAWNAEVYFPAMIELFDNLVADARRRLADMKAAASCASLGGTQACNSILTASA
jgi:hypothetical protein